MYKTLTPLWEPSQSNIQAANISEFVNIVSRRVGVNFNSYAQLHEFSISEPSKFWAEVAEYTKIIFSKPSYAVFAKGERAFRSRWFVGSALNFARNLLRHSLTAESDMPAIVFVNETDTRVELSYKELYLQTARLAEFLRGIGVQKGDRVVGYLPNQPEAVIAMLATASIGAIWSCCSQDFGIESLKDRFTQIQPKVLFATTGYIYKGKFIDVAQRTQELYESLPCLHKTVLVAYPGVALSASVVAKTSSNKVCKWADATASNATDIDFCELPFNHPLYILYSSGTTGIPKCIVHGAGGTLLQHLKELTLHTDVKKGDTVFFYTTTGWMMWHWLVSSLSLGAKVVLYDGSPFYPATSRLWDIVDQEGISAFGASARYFAELQRQKQTLKETHCLKSLRTIMSTGSPLLNEQFKYLYSSVKTDMCVSSISGGTDIISCFILGNPTLPVYEGQLQCYGLGMDVAFVDDKCKRLVDEKGELVCYNAFPSMPIYFWNDPDYRIYENAYFKRWHNVWLHGDYGIQTSTGGSIILGRSDATLNPSGVRIGPAEIYRLLEQNPNILDSVVIDTQHGNDIRIVLFVVTDIGEVTDELAYTIRNEIKRNLSPRHVPYLIFAVKDVPRTLNGKVSEVAVKNAFHGLKVENISAFANPECIDDYVKLGKGLGVAL